MKYYYLIFLISAFSFSQQEGQNFCKGDYINGTYFDISIKKKKIFWYNTYYYEEQIGSKNINGKEYLEFRQTWEKGNSDLLYLRENKGKVYQYEIGFDKETIRYDVKFKVDKVWKKIDKTAIYKIKSYKGTLKTPFCNYENLLIIEAKYEKITFCFYYLKGFGYVGATENDKLISYATPKI